MFEGEYFQEKYPDPNYSPHPSAGEVSFSVICVCNFYDICYNATYGKTATAIAMKLSE